MLNHMYVVSLKPSGRIDIEYSHKMKTFAIILILGFAWRVSNASKYENMKTCLVENGFTDDETDLELIRAIGEPEHVDRLQDVSMEKMAGVMACLFEKQQGNGNLNNALESLVGRDDKATEEEKRKMLETLKTCNTNAAGDNTKLLSCLNIMAPPFDVLIASIRDFDESVAVCFPKCEITIGEMYKMEENKSKVKGLLEIVNEQKLACFMACIVEEEEKNRKSPHFLKALTDLINKSEEHDENQKKEMLETVDKCNAQEVKDKTYRIIKCVNMFKPPFVDLY
ncbi:uncharacterized protein LOC100120839 isoform X2 [Nasonia vitripennis]|uniref:Uncharacterized protein n=1 Tax=Nasonia vitripennis TaxID=7425 RepID=A0A7M7QEA3_NASVI|nr:uncharacterized protein LOC100120839 isoform X2 [Nasonia vitripennis]